MQSTTTNLVVNAVKLLVKNGIQLIPKIAREVVREIGYDREEIEFSAHKFQYINRLHGQSPDISQGVTEEKAYTKSKCR